MVASTCAFSASIDTGCGGISLGDFLTGIAGVLVIHLRSDGSGGFPTPPDGVYAQIDAFHSCPG